jgi:hypothetical protein
VRTQTTIMMAAIAVAVTASAITPRPAAAQAWVTESVCPDNTASVFHLCAIEAAKTFDPPRVSGGGPNIGGVWRLRAPGLYEDLEAHPNTPDDQGGPGAVVDPPDGKVPMHAWADARRKESAEQYIHHNAACLLSGVPETMYMAGVFQFLQTPDNFVILSEDAHAYRSIPLDGSPPVGAKISLWNGDSRGHWEGNTLVIETTNQNGKPWLDQRARFYTEEAFVVERLTLADPDTLHYTATIEDPNVYTTPFTIALAYRRSTEEDFEIMATPCYEYNGALMTLYRNIGYGVYPGISAAEARQALEASQ